MTPPISTKWTTTSHPNHWKQKRPRYIHWHGIG